MSTTRPHWQQEGEAPDYRFTLANERTFLAWLRTALALLAGAVLLDQLGPHYHRGAVLGAALSLCACACGCSFLAYFRWRSNEIAMRNKRALPYTVALPVCAFLVSVATIALAVLLWH